MGKQDSQKAIITAAVSGAIHTPTMSPHLPITPQQLIDDIMSVYEAGGAVAHLHVRDPETGQPKADQEIFFVLGILGGIPATVENLVFLVQTARQQIGDFQWSVCAAGRTQLAMTTHALLMGGHARVGLEDNLYLEKGTLAKSSGEQVAKLKRIADELGVETATPDEARRILGLKGLDKVNF